MTSEERDERRDFFAAAALIGLLANSEGAMAGFRPLSVSLTKPENPEEPSTVRKTIATEAYRMADAMLEARDAS